MSAPASRSYFLDRHVSIFEIVVAIVEQRRGLAHISRDYVPMFAVVAFIRSPDIIGCHKDWRGGNRSVSPKCVLTLIRNGNARQKQVLQILSRSRAQKSKINRPTTDSTAGGREEEGRHVFQLNYGYGRLIAEVAGRGITPPLRWSFQAHGCRAFREKTIGIAFRLRYRNLSPHKFEGVAVAGGRLRTGIHP